MSKAVSKSAVPFGLDIGSDSVKIVQLGHNDQGGLCVVNVLLEEYPSEFRLSPDEKKAKLPEFLKKFLRAHNIQGPCYSVIPSDVVNIDLVYLPKMPFQEIEPALQWNVREKLREQYDAFVYDYLLLQGKDTDFFHDQVGILLVTAPKAEVMTHIALLKSMGLHPLAVDIETLAALAVLTDPHMGRLPDDVILFIDFGGSTTTMSIIWNNELISTRKLNITGNYLTRAVSEYCHVSWEEAEVLKNCYGLIRPEAIGIQGTNTFDKTHLQIRNVLLPILEDLVQDIEHTFKHFSFQVTQSRIHHYNRVVMSGGSSRLRELIPFLNSRLHANVEMMDYVKKFMPSERFKNQRIYLPRLNVAFGLALRGLAL